MRPELTYAPRVAIIHYWLIGMRGGERVLERLLTLFPQADIFTHVHVRERVSDLINAHRIRTTFIQRLPYPSRLYQKYLPLMPLALEEIDLTGYDLVISSESGPAKGVLAPPDALHLCYCHSPMRYLWDQYPLYRHSAGFTSRSVMSPLFHRMRYWDAASAQRVDHFVANSTFIKDRIRRAWGRDSEVVFPPVPTTLYAPVAEPGQEYLWVGSMTSYKRPDLAIQAFNKLRLPLLMVGDGDMLGRLRRMAGPTIRFEPRLKLDALRRAYAACRALVFTAEEDFGIVPVEASASGRPVIAFGRGGVRDTVVPQVTGLFFHRQTAEAVIDAVERFERWLPNFRPLDAVAQAACFSPERFDHGILAAIASRRPDLAGDLTRLNLVHQILPAAMEAVA